MIKTLTILGSTGSIGVQALDVAKLMGLDILALTSNVRTDILESQIREFHPKYAAVADEAKAAELKIKVADTDTEILAGGEGVVIVRALQYGGAARLDRQRLAVLVRIDPAAVALRLRAGQRPHARERRERRRQIRLALVPRGPGQRL
ncbi:MAG: hypothetical protein IK097_03725, partial [Clostridia bacterium]|nr:hypothetical protein [Clostridia bacterium]